MPYQEYPEDVLLCQKVHRQHGKSFYYGTLFLPRKEREATFILYAFFRYPDELVDTLYKDDKERAKEALLNWQKAWQATWNNEIVTDLSLEGQRVLRAAKYIFETYHIPFECSQDFLAAMIQDTYQERYTTYQELEGYMYGSAAVVGVMMTYILCHEDLRFHTDPIYQRELLRTAASLGYAFQLTNFLRDVGEDSRERGRIYLPQEYFDRFQITEADFAATTTSSNLKSLVRFLIEKNHILYQEADTGICLLPKTAQKPILIARVLYSRILQKIVTHNYSVIEKRLALSVTEKSLLVLAILLLPKKYTSKLYG